MVHFYQEASSGSASRRTAAGPWLLGRSLLLLFCSLLAVTAGAQVSRGQPARYFQAEAVAARAAASSPAAAQLRAFRAYTLDVAGLRAALAQAPLEGRGRSIVLELPLPDGRTGRFQLVESPVLAPALAAQYPSIRTYRGQGLDDPAATLRCDFTATGFHAQILSPGAGTVYIEPVSAIDQKHYVVYYQADVRPGAGMAPCETGGPGLSAPPAPRQRGREGQAPARQAMASTGAALRVYNLAIGAPAEFTAAYGGSAGAMSTVATVVNQVKGILELELSVRLVLAGTKLYTDAATDIYTNPGSHGQNVADNQSGLTPAVLGISSYDVGHVFTSSTSGGLAALNSVCSSSNKARGSTGFSVGSLSVVATTVFAHELGHQFGATHSFNSAEANSCAPNRTGATAYEPGAGTTIMSYAAACAPDNSLQYGASPNFHVASFEQIQNFINSLGTCASSLSTGNTAPAVTVPFGGKTLPISTPFKLTAAGSDANNDALTYSWEQVDLGNAALLTSAQTANDNVPLFRVRVPSTSPTRYFPQLSDVLAGNTATSGERLPTVTRTLTFRCGVRDQHNGAQGVVGAVTTSADVSLGVTSAAGPFAVTAPNTAVSWAGNSTQTVTWSVNNTDQAPVNCAAVNIRLSVDGGTTFPYLLAAGTPNDGSQAVTLPNLSATYTTCRIQVEAADNYFYDIGNSNFTLAPISGPVATGLAPSSGAVGTTVTISGSGFGTSAAALGVTIGGVAATITGPVSNTSLQVTVPAAALSGQVIVTKTGTGAGTANAGVFGVTPVITSLSPASAGAGSSITLTGTSFGGVTGITFSNGVTVAAADFTGSSLSTGSTNNVSLVVPATAASGNLYLTTAGGNSAGTAFTMLSFSVTSRGPVRNARTAPVRGAVALTFNQAPSANTAAGAPVSVFSSQHGGKRNADAALGSFSSTGTSVSYTPAATAAFRAGEVLSVTTTSAAANTGGAPLPAETYQFTAAAGKATGAVGTYVDVATGNRPQNVALGDVNGDGLLDAVTSNNNNGSGNTVSVRLGNGAGGLSGTTNLTVGTNPRTVVLADVNNDGKLDILVMCRSSAAIYVLVRNASGTAAGDFTTSTLGVAAPSDGLAVGDVNNDGWLDVVTVSLFGNAAPLRVFLNAKASTGTFGSASTANLTGSWARYLTLADLNNDGHLDVLVLSSANNKVYVALGNGAGGFSQQSDVAVGSTPLSGLAVGDVNNDGHLDMAVVNTASHNVSIRLGNGAGGFTSPATPEITVGDNEQPQQAVLADMNGDANLDLVVTNYYAVPGRLSIRLGNGNGTFTTPATPEYDAGTQSFGLAVADLNHDAALDVVTANFGADNGAEGLSILLGVPTPVVTDISPSSGPVGTAVVVSGTGFLPGSTATVGGVSLSNVTVSSAWPPTLSGTVAASTPAGTQPVVTTTGAQPSNGTVSFTVTTTPMPVELMFFSAERRGSAALLRWATAQELRNDRFEVEVSTNGTRFQRLGQVAGQGTTSRRTDYQFTDPDLDRYAAGMVYYRLRQVDLDGTGTYSPVRVLPATQAVGVQAVPNPFGDALEVNLTLAETSSVQATLRDALGRVVWQRQAELPAGPTQWTVAQPERRPAGVYVLTVQAGSLHRTLKLVHY